MLMPVIRKTGQDATELAILDLNDVLYINIENRNIVYHTAADKFYQISTLSELEEHLFDYNFELLDKTNLINMKKIKHLDSKYGKLYFEEQPTKESKYASVAFIQQKLRQADIHRSIANNTNKSMEFSLKEGANLKEKRTAYQTP